MNLADPELELIDPTPNVHSLFVHFDELFFYTKLVGRALVRWSKRMYSCAGVCSYEGRNGLCDIALSEPLLKLRPRKNLIETLLHEMIHAFLFITNKDNDRDGHGPTFQFHMHRINKAAGLSISIYHDFHDEVNLYLRHWWRCNGKCQKLKPHFGLVRRSANQAPGPSDWWWQSHKRICGGTFIKIKEPEKKQTAKKKDKGITNNDITKYINNNNDNTTNKNVTKEIKTVNKGIINVVAKDVVVPKSGFKKSLNTTIGNAKTDPTSVVEKVRDIWKNKLLTPTIAANVKVLSKTINPTKPSVTNKHKSDTILQESPSKKIKKIDDYFKKTAAEVLKDLYGTDFKITQPTNSDKLKATTIKINEVISKPEPMKTGDLVDCPSCNTKVHSKDINRHLDECLNKDIIETLSKDLVQTTTTSILTKKDEISLKELVKKITNVPTKLSTEIHIDLVNVENKPMNLPKNNNELIDLVKIEVREVNDELSRPSTSKQSDQVFVCCGAPVDKPIEQHVDECLGFFDNNQTIPIEGTSTDEAVVIEDNFDMLKVKIKSEPSTSQELVQKCPCCGTKVNQPIEEHLDECLGFFDNDTTLPEEGASIVETIVIDDDDDEFDESQILNATGTKSPCPCCLKMIEIEDMNAHLDVCLAS